MYRYLLILVPVILAGCQQRSDHAATPDALEKQAQKSAKSSTESSGRSSARMSASDRLAAVLDAQPDDVKARYKYRHPQETLEFFGIEPGMTVVEGLPGRGWYSKLLVNYLGSGGRLIGANYAMDMWPLFPFANEEFLARQAAWIETFKTDAAGWRGEDGAAVDGFYFGSLPAALEGVADVAFFPRVLHNLANFQNAGHGDFLDQALADTYAILKPGGVFGIVQHHARDNMSDEFADGSHGYLKKGWLIGQVRDAGFEFVAESAINANDKDQPTEEDIVWRLPPSYALAGDDAEQKAALDAIGESNRMTLKFRKPE